MIRISKDESVPHHHESLPLRGGIAAAGWAVAVLGIGGGLLVVAQTSGTGAEAAGSLLVVLGGLFLAAMLRCRRHDASVGTKRIEVGAGPLQRMVPTGAVESTSTRPATGWRRLFADTEVVLGVSVSGGDVVIPTQAADELIRAIDELLSPM